MASSLEWLVLFHSLKDCYRVVSHKARGSGQEGL